MWEKDPQRSCQLNSGLELSKKICSGNLDGSELSFPVHEYNIVQGECRIRRALWEALFSSPETKETLEEPGKQCLQRKQNSVVLVGYCCVTNYPKLNGLKQHSFMT